MEREEQWRKIDEEQLKFSEWKRKCDVVKEEVDRKYDAEIEELDKKHKADHLKRMDEIEELDKKCKADHLKRMDEIKYGPPIPHIIIPHSIPSVLVQQVKLMKANSPYKVTEVLIPTPPVQKVVSLQVAQKRTALNVHFKTLKIPVTKLSTFEPNRIIECQIISPPIQKVLSFQASCASDENQHIAGVIT